MLVVPAAEALRALDPFQLAVDDHGGVISNVKRPMLLKDVPLLISRYSASPDKFRIANMQTNLWQLARECMVLKAGEVAEWLKAAVC